MKDIWGKVSTVMLGCIVIFIIIPLIVALVTTAHIIDVDTESQWIGFCGNYLGALIGGAISGGVTVYVLFRTLEDNKKTLEATLHNNKLIQKRSEIIAFSNLLTEKSSKIMPTITDVAYKAVEYLNADAKEELMNFSTAIRIAESNLISISLQIDAILEDDDYIPEKAKDISEKSIQLRDFLEYYFKTVIEALRSKDKVKIDSLELDKQKLQDLTNEVANDLIRYQRLLMK